MTEEDQNPKQKRYQFSGGFPSFEMMNVFLDHAFTTGVLREQPQAHQTKIIELIDSQPGFFYDFELLFFTSADFLKLTPDTLEAYQLLTLYFYIDLRYPIIGDYQEDTPALRKRVYHKLMAFYMNLKAAMLYRFREVEVFLPSFDGKHYLFAPELFMYYSFLLPDDTDVYPRKIFTSYSFLEDFYALLSIPFTDYRTIQEEEHDD